MAHVHADVMVQYAEDAKKHDNPWERWEYNDGRGWHACPSHPYWFPEHVYRRKQRAIKIAGYKVPEPCQVNLEHGNVYYVPEVTRGTFIIRRWACSYTDFYLLESKLVHVDSESATVHAKALLEVSKGWWK